jgi:hypothetical protein
MTDFEAQVKAAAEKAVLHFIESGGWLLPNYQGRLKVPEEWMAECWKLVDADKVRTQIAPLVERLSAAHGVAGGETQLAVGLLLQGAGGERRHRERLRALVRDHMDSIMKAGPMAKPEGQS